MLFVIEDVHWLDPTTLELIKQALDILSRFRILLISARPTFEHRFGDHPSFTRLALNRLLPRRFLRLGSFHRRQCV